MKMAQSDPDVKKQMIAQAFNVTIPEKDPISKQKDELKIAITNQALKLIQEDPELSEELARQQAYEILQVRKPSSSHKGSDDGEYYSGRDGHSISDSIREVEEAKELLGADKSGLSSLFDKDVIIEVIKQLGPAFMANRNQAQLPQAHVERKVIMLNEQGQLAEYTESQYSELLNKGMLRPVAAIAPPAPAPKEVASAEKPAVPGPEPQASMPTSKPSPAEPGVQSISIPDNAGSLIGYLELPPEDFVTQMSMEAEAGNETARTVLDFLVRSDYNTIVNTISGFKDNPLIEPYIERLMSPEGKEWVEEVIERLKEN